MRKIIVSIFITSLFLAISPPAYSEKYSRETIHLSAGDQLILEEIKKVNERIDKVNERIDKVNERIDKVNERIDKVNERIATEMGNVNERITTEMGNVNERIDKVNERIATEMGNVNERIDKVNERIATEMGNVSERIDFLWATMVGGFLGVMIFVGGIVFWDRRTTLAPVHNTITELSQREKVLEDVLKDFAKDEPGLMQRLRIAGLL